MHAFSKNKRQFGLGALKKLFEQKVKAFLKEEKQTKTTGRIEQNFREIQKNPLSLYFTIKIRLRVCNCTP